MTQLGEERKPPVAKLSQGHSPWSGREPGARHCVSTRNLPETMAFYLKGINENVLSMKNCSLCFKWHPELKSHISVPQKLSS